VRGKPGAFKPAGSVRPGETASSFTWLAPPRVQLLSPCVSSSASRLTFPRDGNGRIPSKREPRANARISGILSTFVHAPSTESRERASASPGRHVRRVSLTFNPRRCGERCARADNQDETARHDDSVSINRLNDEKKSTCARGYTRGIRCALIPSIELSGRLSQLLRAASFYPDNT